VTISSMPSRYVTRTEHLSRYPQWGHRQRPSGRPPNGASSNGKFVGIDSNAIRISPQSTMRPSYSPKVMAGRSALDTCFAQAEAAEAIVLLGDPPHAGRGYERLAPTPAVPQLPGAPP
jgi:hypothetical protein